ncbi:MAG: peptide-methionine (S)-S-oxide reductase MsrA [Acidiferrobacteraceae bacterium]
MNHDDTIHVFPEPPEALESATPFAVLAGGCFWCVEAVFREVSGVTGVTPGYTGGDRASANYEAVCRGTTGHAEAVRIEFDPARITFGDLLKIFFFAAHDPTQKDRQGADRGTQYRSAIFYADEGQKRVAERYIETINAARVLPGTIVTEVAPLTEFYPAEPYHHDYAARNPGQPYIRYVSTPKVEKLRLYFAPVLNRSKSGGKAS